MTSLQDAAGVSKRALDAASAYLAEHLHLLWEPFQVSIVTYALHVSDHLKKSPAFTRLQEVRREGRHVYWSEQEVPDIPSDIINTVTYLHPRKLYPFECKAVQATCNYNN